MYIVPTLYYPVCRNFAMNPEHSPFTPNQPVNADFFTGRKPQIENLLSTVRKAAQGTMQIGWISGERGIGKSSLASFVGFLAERDEKAPYAHVHLGGVNKLEDMVRETHLSLLKDNQSKSWGKNLLRLFGDKVRQIGLFGVEIQLEISNKELVATTNNFAESLNQIIKEAGEDRKVLFLILDDINRLAGNSRFAHWLKSMMDSVATSRMEVPVCLIFVGLEERLDTMMESNPSVGRIFRPMIQIEPREKADSQNFFVNAFRKRNVRIERDTGKLLAEYCGGLPTLAHEIGDSVWRNAENNAIDHHDLFEGVIDAAYSVGTRFIQKEVIRALRSNRYHSILRKIAKDDNTIGIKFPRKKLLSLETLTATERTVLDHFLKRMKTLGGIVPVQDGERGVYRFPTHMHRIYFLLEANALAQKGKTLN